MNVKTCQTSLRCLRFLQHQHARPENSGLLLVLQVYLGKERKPFAAPVSGGLKRNKRRELVWQLILLSRQSHGSRLSCLLTTCEKELSQPERAVTGRGRGRAGYHPTAWAQYPQEGSSVQKTERSHIHTWCHLACAQGPCIHEPLAIHTSLLKSLSKVVGKPAGGGDGAHL